MLSEMSYDDFLTWRAFDEISPIGDKRGDWQAASVCSAIFNSMAISRGVAKRFKTSDFLLEFVEDGKESLKVEPPPPAPKQQSWQQMKFFARAFAKQANAEVEKRNNRGRRR